MYAVYDLAHKIPIILSIVVILSFLMREFISRRQNGFTDASPGGIPGASDYYTRGGHLVRMVKRGWSYRAYLTEDIVMPNLRHDMFGAFIDTGCRSEEDAELFVDRIL